MRNTPCPKAVVEKRHCGAWREEQQKQLVSTQRAASPQRHLQTFRGGGRVRLPNASPVVSPRGNAAASSCSTLKGTISPCGVPEGP